MPSLPAVHRWRLSVGVGAVVMAVGAYAGAGPLSDNSFLTHLATGRIFWDGGGWPRTDPYTFTASGEPWVVQSWFASLLYGAVEQLGGLKGVRYLVVATTALLAGLTWTLTRAAETIGGRAVIVAPALLIGVDSWQERPLLFGLVCLGFVLLAAEGRLATPWLVGVGWVWANVHGSWPLGLVALAISALGTHLDAQSGAVVHRSAVWLVAGLGLGAVNPYGPAILTFPFRLLGRSEGLEGIVEWGPPTFDRTGDWAFLALLIVGLLALRRRPTWRHGLLLAVFVPAAFLGSRNIVVASLVLLPGMARGMSGLGSITGNARTRTGQILAGAAVAMSFLIVLFVVRTTDFDEQPYPVEAVRFLQETGLDPAEHRVIAREFVGNWLEAVNGPTGTVFVDDRIEVIPLEVLADHRHLLRGRPGWEEILARYRGEAVLWQTDSPLAEELRTSGTWDIVYRDHEWLVAVPA